MIHFFCLVEILEIIYQSVKNTILIGWGSRWIFNYEPYQFKSGNHTQKTGWCVEGSSLVLICTKWSSGCLRWIIIIFDNEYTGTILIKLYYYTIYYININKFDILNKKWTSVDNFKLLDKIRWAQRKIYLYAILPTLVQVHLQDHPELAD